ncbi:uncharacterized protein DEA37_0001941 [Paragonimus westermani]|uniref:Uncharacterized protein n=1 Tax=Paragonimus westermani TaxID=34504 RepID=A0A5J4NSQ2_9TREM|nr:uncharacterized protein DEA37_0001941 [Paragonimus westermani]
MTGLLPIGFEFAAELTYPVNEGLTSGLLNASCQIFGIIFITSGSHMISVFDVKYCNTFFTCLIALGLGLLGETTSFESLKKFRKMSFPLTYRKTIIA